MIRLSIKRKIIAIALILIVLMTTRRCSRWRS